MVEWRISAGLVEYPAAVAQMEQRVEAMAKGAAPELVWLLEHPALYTAGTSAQRADLLAPDRFAVYRSTRGGQYTYHGPGQRVAYVMLDLGKRGRDVRRFVQALEHWLILTLAEFNIRGETRPGRVGVWVPCARGSAKAQDAKIAAIGIRLRRWISFHGVSLNVDPNLEHFSGIHPCGMADHGVTSLVDLGLPCAMEDVDRALRSCFGQVFGD
ncbi:MAG: lipoyl(octanoyl) transferase LipB [Rhodobacteraceae bacterium]|nr:lipoyl(octanoyl) transferase LipB [Paracoccaceae bacterium]